MAQENLIKSCIRLQVIQFFDTVNWILQSECWQGTATRFLAEVPSWLSQICPKHPSIAPPTPFQKAARKVQSASLSLFIFWSFSATIRSALAKAHFVLCCQLAKSEIFCHTSNLSKTLGGKLWQNGKDISRIPFAALPSSGQVRLQKLAIQGQINDRFLTWNW